MIIECPHCGFSGRVPERAILAPHQARCPKCRSRFDVGDPDVHRPEPVVPFDLRHDLARPRLDPSDSSYELNPLGADYVSGLDGSWDEDWDEVDGVPRPSKSSSTIAASGLGFVAGRLPLPAWGTRLLRPWLWRVRLFQAWAVLLMAVALVIVVRTAIAAFSFDDDRFFSDGLLRPIASVVLLVCASALLCLYVDVSRRLGRTTYAPRPAAPPADVRRDERPATSPETAAIVRRPAVPD